MQDVATLGIAVKSDEVTKGATELDKLAAAAKQATAAKDQLVDQVEAMSASEKRATDAVRQLREARQQATAATKAYTTAQNAADKAARGLIQRQTQLAYQTNDVVSGLVMGQPPMMIFAQQSGQIAQIYAGNGGVNAALQDVSKTFKSLFALIGRAAPYLAAVAAIGGVSYALYRLAESAAEAERQIDEQMASVSVTLGETADIAREVNLARIAREANEGTADIYEFSGALGSIVETLQDVRIQKFMAASEQIMTEIGDQQDTIEALERRMARAREDLRKAESATPNSRGVTSDDAGRAQKRIERARKDLGLANSQLANLQARYTQLGAVLPVEEANKIKEALASGDMTLAAQTWANALKEGVKTADQIRREQRAVAREAEAEAKREAREQEAEDGRRQSAMESLSKKADAFNIAQLKANDDQVAAINARYDVEYKALLELGQKAIQNGETVENANRAVEEARVLARADADAKIADYRQKQTEEEAKEAQRRADILEDIRLSNRDLDRTSGVFDISGPHADEARKLGRDTVAGISGIQDRAVDDLALARENYLDEQALYQGNKDELLRIEQEYQERVSAIKADANERQGELILRSQEAVRQGVLSDMNTITAAAGEVVGEQSAAYRLIVGTQKAAALAMAAIAAPAAAAKAMAEVPFPANYIAAAAVYANVAMLAAQVGKVAFGGNRELGGPVSPGMMYEVGERGKPEMFHQNGKSYLIPGNNGNVVPFTQGIGSSSSSNVNVKVENYGSSKIEVQEMGEGDIRIIARDEATRAVAPTFKREMARPNSVSSRAVGRNTTARRQRP